MAWHLGSRLDEVHEQLLAVASTQMLVLKVLATSGLEMSQEVRSALLSSASRTESVHEQHEAFLNDARAFFLTLSKP